jgi:hypothetical protein
MNKKFLDGFYIPKTLGEYFEDYNCVLENYLNQSRGLEKSKIFINFALVKEKDHIEYFSQKVR